MQFGLTNASIQERRKFLAEMRLMTRMKHRNIVKCYGGAMAKHDGERDIMVLEYLPGGTLDNYIHCKRRENRLRLMEVLGIAISVADALTYLHPDLVHRDLKPCNILFTEDGVLKLTDFGISQMKQDMYLSRCIVGTPTYTPPEIWRNDKHVWLTDFLISRCSW
jgi:eukaryotic-like serine/threonine-protein kinase